MYQIHDNRLGTKSECWLCLVQASDPTKNFEDHHIVPRHLGGTNGPLVYLCSDCHTNVHACAEKLEKGKSYLPYKEHDCIKKCLYLAKVIADAAIMLKQNPQNKIFVISGILDYKTHTKLVELTKYFGAKKRTTQIKVIKHLIDEFHKKYL